VLRVNDIEVVYDNAVLVLKGISVAVDKGCITAVLGANGAGKTTTLKAISGLLYGERGALTRGTIELDGERIDRLAPHEVVMRGVVQVFEGRRVFANLSVEDNLLVGGHVERRLARVRETIEQVYGLFPRLKERRRQDAGYLSGGEQQMLAIGRALVSGPKVILLDEPSLGLAPLVAAEIFRTIVRLKEELGMTVLLVEQNAAMALDIADAGYVMETGRIMLQGPVAELRENAAVREFYLGLNESGARRSYREARSAARRRRWLA
jgi:branched-chain amino acid transport system ATP-binding protein